jgi:hypothetical protein
MQPLNYIISIPEPCHEDWNSMTPDANGKFCNSCSKSVIDFTNKTDAEIHTMMMERKNEKVCGHFNKTQVNRPFALTIPYHTLPRNLSSTRAFAVALFIVFGTLLFSCTDEHNQKINEITLIGPERTEGMMLGDIAMAPIQEVIDTVKSITSEGVSVCKTTGDVSYEEVPVIDSVSEVMVKGESIVTIERSSVLGGAFYYLPVGTTEKDTVVSYKQAKPEVIHPELDFNLQAYPNPTTGNINISYEVVKRGNVQLDLFDIKGVLVKSLVSQQNQYEGKYTIPTDVSDLVNGIYICRVIVSGIEKTTKLIIAK